MADIHASMVQVEAQGAQAAVRRDVHPEELAGALGGRLEPVLAVMPRQRSGQWAQILETRADHETFYRNA